MTPTGTTPGCPAVDAYIEFTLAHFIRRWEAVFRGSPRIMKDTEINQDQLRRFNVVLFGTPESNAHVATVFNRTGRMALPIEWSDGSVRVAGESYDSGESIPLVDCVCCSHARTVHQPVWCRNTLVVAVPTYLPCVLSRVRLRPQPPMSRVWSTRRASPTTMCSATMSS